MRGTDWKLAKSWPSESIPEYLRPWLLDPTSTTKRFREAGGETFVVQVLYQDWKKIYPSERQILEFPDDDLGFVREVMIYCKGEAWMFARCVFPGASLTGENAYLPSALDERPLGDLLYCDPSLQRSPFELALLEKGSCEFDAPDLVPFFDELLWARRSVFLLRTKPLLLTEVFLPALVNYCRLKIKVRFQTGGHHCL